MTDSQDETEEECEHQELSGLHEDDGHECYDCSEEVLDIDGCYECALEQMRQDYDTARAELAQAHFDRMKLATALEEMLDEHHGDCSECSADGPSPRHQKHYELIQWFRKRMKAQS